MVSSNDLWGQDFLSGPPHFLVVNQKSEVASGAPVDAVFILTSDSWPVTCALDKLKHVLPKASRARPSQAVQSAAAGGRANF
jgi:hypothetical protein